MEPNEVHRAPAVELARDLIEVQPDADLDMDRRVNLALVRLMEAIDEWSCCCRPSFRRWIDPWPGRETANRNT